MTRDEVNRLIRVALHKKQERLKVDTGAPSVSSLTEGIPILRSTDEGLVEYVRYNGVLYKSVFSKAEPQRGVTAITAAGKTWDEI